MNSSTESRSSTGSLQGEVNRTAKLFDTIKTIIKCITTQQYDKVYSLRNNEKLDKKFVDFFCEVADYFKRYVSSTLLYEEIINEYLAKDCIDPGFLITQIKKYKLKEKDQAKLKRIVEEMKTKETMNMERTDRLQRSKKNIEDERNHMELENKKKIIRLDELQKLNIAKQEENNMKNRQILGLLEKIKQLEKKNQEIDKTSQQNIELFRNLVSEREEDMERIMLQRQNEAESYQLEIKKLNTRIKQLEQKISLPQAPVPLKNYEHFYRYYYDPQSSLLNQISSSQNISQVILTNIQSVTKQKVNKVKNIYQYSEKLKQNGFYQRVAQQRNLIFLSMTIQGKIIGGFTNRLFNIHSPRLTSEELAADRSFLFTIEDNQLIVFSLKEGYQSLKSDFSFVILGNDELCIYPTDMTIQSNLATMQSKRLNYEGHRDHKTTFISKITPNTTSIKLKSFEVAIVEFL